MNWRGPTTLTVIVALLCACDADAPEPESEELPAADIHLSFGIARVQTAPRVSLSAFRGPSLLGGEPDECDGVTGHHHRLIRLSRSQISVDGQTLLSLDDGWIEDTVAEANATLDSWLGEMRSRADSIRSQRCVSGFSARDAERVLIAVEDEMPVATVQLLLLGLRRAGFMQPSFWVESIEEREEPGWNPYHAVPVFSGAGQEVADETESSMGVVSLSEPRWSQVARRHAELSAMGVGCISYAWGSGRVSERPEFGEGEVRVAGREHVAVLSLSPLRISTEAHEAPPEQILVTGARCGIWGQQHPERSPERGED